MNIIKKYIKRPYIQRNLVVDKNSIKKMIRPEWHREFREFHVNLIKSSLLKGNHPSENITVNEVNNSKRILNGNHRMQAIRDVIAKNPGFKIEMTFTIYSNLSKDQEIVIYEKVNNNKRETGIDKLKAHLSGTLIYKLLSNSFPFRIVYRSVRKGEVNVMSAGTIILGYANRNKMGSGALTNILNKIKQYDDDDYDRMVKFANFFTRILGEPSRDNLYSGFNMYIIFSKLYFTLVGTDLKEEEFEQKIKRIIARDTSHLLMFNKGVDKQKDLYLFIHSRLSGRKKLFNIMEHTGNKNE